MDPGRALVVGATSEIGAAVVARLLDRGFDVVAWGRSSERLAALPDAVTTTQVDVTDPGRVDEALAELDDAPGPLRAVVWAAGLFDWGPADEADPRAWADLLEVNLVAAARTTPLFLRRLKHTPGGTLVFIGSGAAHRVFPDNAAYVASKHGLAALAAASFLDVKRHGVRVSMVSPGLVAAGAGLRSGEDPARLLRPADVAGAVEYVVTFPGHGCPVLVELQPLI